MFGNDQPPSDLTAPPGFRAENYSDLVNDSSTFVFYEQAEYEPQKHQQLQQGV